MSIVLGTATAYVQRSTDEIILNVNHQEGIDRTNDLYAYGN